MNSETDGHTNNTESTEPISVTANGIDEHNPPESESISVKQEQQQKRPKLETSRESSIDILPNIQNQQPMHEIVGGSSVRRYLNEHLTNHLLEGLKEVSQVKPEDPLRYLGEFLLNRSEELKK